MVELKAQVKDGRLILDEPTDLPDGTVVKNGNKILPPIVLQQTMGEKAIFTARFAQDAEKSRC
jgi:hypothetical protein